MPDCSTPEPDPYPATLTVGLEKVETLRYGENPHQPAARYRRAGLEPRRRARSASSAPPLQGKALSYNNVLDAAAASALGRALRGPGVVIVKHTNPCGAAERPALLAAWEAALEADPVSAFGGVVALTREVDRAVAEALTSIFLEIVIAPAFTAEALEVLATKPNLRVLLDELLASDDPRRRTPRPSPLGSIRTAGGAVLVTAPDVLTDVPDDLDLRDPPSTRRRGAARPRSRVAARPRRDIQRDRPGSRAPAGRHRQRPDVTRGRRASGGRSRPTRCSARTSTVGAACASDAFFPFADAVEACLAAGVRAFAQPGGSMRDAEAIAAVDRLDGTMLMTGIRHFRH